MSQKSSLVRLFVCGAAIVALAACMETGKETAPHDVSGHAPVLAMPDAPVFKNIDPGTSEELLAAEGKWNLVEEGDVYDPAQAHMAARKKVNTKQMKNRDDLVAHFEPDPKNGRDGKFRVLKMQPSGAGWQDDLDVSGGYQVAETAISKPTQKVIGTELVASIRSAFEESEMVDPPESVAEVPTSKPMEMMQSDVVRPPPLPSVRKSPVYETAQAEPEFVLKTESSKKPPVPEKREGILGTLKKTFGQDKKPVEVARQADITAASPPPRVTYQIISSGQAAGGKAASLTGFRSALHEGKTRIAMDLSTSVKYKVAIDQIRNVLRVKLEKTRWTEPPNGTMRASGLLGTYVTNPQPDGSTILEIRLKKKAKIADTMILKPDQTAHHRIVIDLET